MSFKIVFEVIMERCSNLEMTDYCAFKTSTSVNVWVGIIDKFLIGPFSLDGKLTGTKYVHFLSTRLHEILEEVPVDIRLCTN